MKFKNRLLQYDDEVKADVGYLDGIKDLLGVFEISLMIIFCFPITLILSAIGLSLSIGIILLFILFCAAVASFSLG